VPLGLGAESSCQGGVVALYPQSPPRISQMGLNFICACQMLQFF